MKISRSAFVKSTAGVTAAASFSLPAVATTPLFSRHSIYRILTQCSLTWILTAYETGVSAMLALSPTDPRSWIYQANMHGTTSSVLSPGWNSCQHGSYFFFSWHRMYLYYFERIVRAFSGHSAFTLPFWDYSNGLLSGNTENVLPLPFRDPTTSLYTTHRNAGVNSGAALPASAIAIAASMADTAFSTGGGSSGQGPWGIGGGVPSPDEPAQQGSFTGDIEQQPHNVVHDAIGGLMGHIHTAAQDPIFFLHHTNIDRLWVQWLASGNGRVDPSDTIWLTTPFTFYDEHANPVVMTGQQIISTTALGYVYASAAPIAVGAPLCSNSAPQTRANFKTRMTSSLDAVLARSASPAMPLMGAIAAHGVQLKAPRVVVAVDVSLKPDTLQALRAESPLQTTLALRFDGISYDRSPGYYYEIYLNLPDGLAPNYLDEFYVGNLSFFGSWVHVKGQMVKRPEIFNISKIVQRQVHSGVWNEHSAKITLIMQGATDPTRAQTAVGANTRVDSVVITDSFL